MIEDCTHENGPLIVIPGSHRGPIYDHHQDGVFAGGIDPVSLVNLLDGAVELTGRAGSITIHHVRTLHASGNNTGMTTRPLLLFSYAAVDAFPVFYHYDLAEFDSRIVRGEPTLEGRMEALPFRISQPRKSGAGSIFDDQTMMQRAVET